MKPRKKLSRLDSLAADIIPLGKFILEYNFVNTHKWLGQKEYREKM